MDDALEVRGALIHREHSPTVRKRIKKENLTLGMIISMCWPLSFFALIMALLFSKYWAGIYLSLFGFFLCHVCLMRIINKSSPPEIYEEGVLVPCRVRFPLLWGFTFIPYTEIRVIYSNPLFPYITILKRSGYVLNFGKEYIENVDEFLLKMPNKIAIDRENNVYVPKGEYYYDKEKNVYVIEGELRTYTGKVPARLKAIQM